MLLSLIWIFASRARAEQARPLAYDLRVDIPLTALGVGMWLASAALDEELTPAQCRWCDDNAFDRRARAALRWSDPEPAATLSDVLVACVVPAVGLGGLAIARVVDRVSMRDAWLDALFVVEATGVALTLNQIVKFAAARERPYAHADDYAGQPHGAFARTSFYSGHTNLAFALASSSGMVASLRGLRAAPVIWSVGLALATLVGYARVAADYHYLSDVLMGAGMGSIVGAGLPWLMHRPRLRGRVQVSAGARAFVLSWRH